MKRNLFCFLALMFYFTANSQVKIGENIEQINQNAVLDIESANKGLLIPRIGLVSTQLATPLNQHVAGMVVYNLNTSDTGEFRVTPGMYFNDGTRWVRTQPFAQQEIKKAYYKITHAMSDFNTPLPVQNPAIEKNGITLYRNGVLLMQDIDYEVESPGIVRLNNVITNLLSNDDEIKIIQIKN